MKASNDSKSDAPPTKEHRRAYSSGRAVHILVFAGLFGLLLLLSAYSLAGKFGAEKAATSLVMPIGAFWLLFSGVVIERVVRRRLHAWPYVVLWMLFSTAGTSPLPDACMRFLETRETVFQPGVDADLDLLVVLGGGTSQGPTRAQAGGSGDRVLLAAQLLIQGRTKRLITTGESAPGLTGDRSSPQEQTIEIWTGLGIDRDAIGTLGGLNTYQEIQNLKKMMPELAGQRVGLLTSGYHLPRAMRLARAQGLSELVPVAADYQSNSESYSFSDFIPNAGSFAQLARCQHEFMAAFVGR